MPEATSSAPEGAAKTVQTASKITICQSFLCGVVKGVSLPSILPLEAGYSKLWFLEITSGPLVNSGGLANCPGNADAKELRLRNAALQFGEEYR